MKKIIIALAIIVATQSNVIAQNKVKEKIESARIAVISNKLNLTEAEAIKFWPVYNAYSDALALLRQERRTYTNTLRNIEGANDADLDKALNGLLAIEEKELVLRKKYKVEFMKILSIRQVAQLFEAEQEFKKMLLQKVGARMDESNNGGRRKFFNR